MRAGFSATTICALGRPFSTSSVSAKAAPGRRKSERRRIFMEGMRPQNRISAATGRVDLAHLSPRSQLSHVITHRLALLLILAPLLGDAGEADDALVREALAAAHMEN